MPTSNPSDILLAHDRWASRQILEACSKLTPEQFHQRFEMGPGSLHDTTTHIIQAMRLMSDLLAGREVRPRLEPAEHRTPGQLLALLEETADDFGQLVRSHPLEGIVTRERGGKTYSFTRGAVATHVTTHGMHHRAQCLNMFRHLSVKPLPPSSVMEWTWMADSALG
jgi:uncharacterized damage-inducible protein DinB